MQKRSYFVKTDESPLHIFDLNDNFELINYMYDYENLVKFGVHLYKKSDCACKPNVYGHKLLDLCRKNNIYIVNGRKGKDSLKGERTCQNVSLIDYFIASSKLFPYIAEFEVKEFCPLLSDVHRPLHITIQGQFNTSTNKVSKDEDGHNESRCAAKWDNNKVDEIINCISSNSNLQEIADAVDGLVQKQISGEVLTLSNINSVIDSIGQLFDDAANTVLGTRYSIQTKGKHLYSYTSYSPWFDNKCKEKRKLFHKARKIYNLHKNDVNHLCLQNTSREYKRELGIAFQKYQDGISSEIRQASKNNPTKFWDILNKCSDRKRKNDSDIPLSDLYEYFKELNFCANNDLVFDGNNENIVSDMAAELLNGPITHSEIESVICGLANDKASGIDCIRNEYRFHSFFYMKYTLNMMLPIYTKIFNLIFDNGIVQEA